MTVLSCEEDVVVLAGIEGRIEVDEIDGLVSDVSAKYVEVVATVKEIGLCHRGMNYQGVRRQSDLNRRRRSWNSKGAVDPRRLAIQLALNFSRSEDAGSHPLSARARARPVDCSIPRPALTFVS